LPKFFENMRENLVIVESPAKAKTIEKFLGKDFMVTSSLGHIRDLAKKGLGIDIQGDFEPEYEVSPEKRKVVAELKKLAKDAKLVWLASDEDREGEAIAWHLFETLKLKEESTKRIAFHEITKEAILKAIENPRKVDKNLVDAQQARRVLDRLVGFEISPVLWKKVKPSLSAGRVQSVAVRLLVEREREVLNFKSVSTYKIVGHFLCTDDQGKNIVLKAELTNRFNSKEEALAFLEKCKVSKFSISDIVTRPSKRSPAAPFTTSTLQQEASRKLGFSVSQTMSIAQKLYEEGKITYMRTDSVNLSETAISGAKNEILSSYGNEYLHTRNYKTKTKGAQEAHEAIRPTYMDSYKVSGTLAEQKLYELIRLRTIASQMSDALFEKTTITIGTKSFSEQFVAIGEVLKFDGFLKVYRESTDEDNENSADELLPPVEINQSLELDKIIATEQFSHHPPRYTEASLVKKLEELGIGRPSTYAPIISTIQQRGYVIKESRDGIKRNYTMLTFKNLCVKEDVKSEMTGVEKQKLFPTDIGMVVTDFLLKYFQNILEYNFTANVEKDFDAIADGKMQWKKMISTFYFPFHQIVENTLEKSEYNVGERKLGVDPVTGKLIIARIGRFGPIVQLGDSTEETDKRKYASLRKDQLIETITLEEAVELLSQSSEGRLLGTDPESGKPLFARLGRFGQMVQIGTNDDPDKPRFASLLRGQTVDNVTLEQALELFRLPRKVGEFEGKEIVAAIGKFGPYLRHDSKFVSLKKTDDPFTVNNERAIELIEEKRKSDTEKIIKVFAENENLKIIKDRWGHPCVNYKKIYFRIPNKVEPDVLSFEECYKMIEADIEALEKKSAKSKKSADSSKPKKTTKSVKKPASKTKVTSKSEKKK
jgi:DNA topoisomerase I